MKKVLLMLVLAFFTSATLNAADNKERAAQLAGNMEKELGLNAEQKTKVYDAALSRFNNIDAISSKTNPVEQDKIDMMMEKRMFINDMRSILTPEQYKTWQTLRTDQVHAMRAGEKVEKPVVDQQLELMQY